MHFLNSFLFVPSISHQLLLNFDLSLFQLFFFFVQLSNVSHKLQVFFLAGLRSSLVQGFVSDHLISEGLSHRCFPVSLPLFHSFNFRLLWASISAGELTVFILVLLNLRFLQFHLCLEGLVVGFSLLLLEGPLFCCLLYVGLDSLIMHSPVEVLGVLLLAKLLLVPFESHLHTILD